MSKDKRIDELAAVELFSSCTKKELQRLAGITDLADVPDGKVLCQEGQRGHECFVIREGKVRVSVDGSPVAVLGPGAVVGEMALLSRRPRVARVVADGPVSLYVIGARAFQPMLEDNPGLAMRLLRTLSDRLADLELDVLAGRAESPVPTS